MTKKQLIEALESFKDDEFITVAVFFTEGTAEMCEVESVSRNGKCAQLSVRGVSAAAHAQGDGGSDE